MRFERAHERVMVFDIGGTWFRWGLYDTARGLLESQRAPAINYRSQPVLNATQLQSSLVDFILERARQMRSGSQCELRTASISVGAPVNAHNGMVLGSGPLWGPSAQPFHLQARLREAWSDMDWYIVNDVTALLAPYMNDDIGCGKTMVITVSTGVGSRLYDHQAERIPYDSVHGIQGEIGHLTALFELDGRRVNRRCECGGWNHLNAFSSGRGIAETLRCFPALSSKHAAVFTGSTDHWQSVSDEHRLRAFGEQLEKKNVAAIELLDALVTPLAQTILASLSLDPGIGRIVITGGVAHGLGKPYRDALERVLAREGLYQITTRDPDYVLRRLRWHDADDFAGLRGAAQLAYMRN